MWLYTHLHRRFGPRDRLTRREMLARSLAAGAGLLLSNQLPFGRLEAAAGRVIVIGAGFSGLAAAHELHAAGYDVTVVGLHSILCCRLDWGFRWAPT
jgi:NADPH-dependent 2,4-dienoyl-CoA reductase/sulfur reductase-like enzyme